MSVDGRPRRFFKANSVRRSIFRSGTLLSMGSFSNIPSIQIRPEIVETWGPSETSLSENGGDRISQFNALDCQSKELASAEDASPSLHPAIGASEKYCP